MKKTLLIIMLFNSLMLFGQIPANDSHWNLVWEDNFNSLDTDIWNVQHEFDHWGGEPQVYTNRSSNVTVNNGNLELILNRETYSCQPNNINQWKCVRQSKSGQPYEWTSGWIETKEDFNVLYGYMESRMKLPHGQALWPAWWTATGQNVTTTNANEMDIFEMLGTKPATVMGTNFVQRYCTTCQPNVPGADSICVTWDELYTEICPWEDNTKLWYGIDQNIPNYTNWITYGFEWTPEKLTWYINGKRIRSSPNVENFGERVRVIYNLALSFWDGYEPNENTPSGAKMLVDYMRVYEMQNDCNTVINNCSYDFTNHDERVKKSITLGGSCHDIFGSGENINLRATDFILIKNMTLQDGAEMYLDVTSCY